MSNLHLADEEYRNGSTNPMKWGFAILLGLLFGAFVGLFIALSTGLIEIRC